MLVYMYSFHFVAYLIIDLLLQKEDKRSKTKFSFSRYFIDFITFLKKIKSRARYGGARL